MRKNIKKLRSQLYLILLEVQIKSSVVKRIKKEFFELLWAYHFYKLIVKTKYNNLTKRFSTKFKITKYIKSKKPHDNKNNVSLIANKIYSYEPVESIKFDSYVIYESGIEKQIYHCLLKPIFQHEIWHYVVADITSVVFNKPQIADNAYKFFSAWNDFITTSISADDFTKYESLFPLEITQDYFFQRGLERLEKNNGSKIITFLAIYMLNRQFNHKDYFFDRMETGHCFLNEIFRHKNSLGWFIAFLEMQKFSLSLASNAVFNIENVIKNLSYIYENLEKKGGYNYIGKPIILATGSFLALIRLTDSGYNFAAQTNLLMFEITKAIDDRISVINNIEINSAIYEEQLAALFKNKHKMMNVARLLDYPTFTKHIRTNISSADPEKFAHNIAFQEHFAKIYAELYKELYPNNKNTLNFWRTLLGDSGKTGTFSKEIASVGISQHFEEHKIINVGPVINKSMKIYSAFEYALKLNNKELTYVEVKPYDSRNSSILGIKNEYQKQCNKGDVHVLLVVDYSNKALNPTIKEKISALQNQVKSEGLEGKVIFVNSSSLDIQINNTVLQAGEDVVIPKLELNKQYYKTLSYKEQNMLSGKTPMKSEDYLRLRHDFVEHFELNTEVKKMFKSKK